MKMKDKKGLFLFVVVLLLPFQSNGNTQRTCKTQIVQSFTMTSRIVPNRINSVCPLIVHNCCTSHDQMRMHKIWTEHASVNVNSVHKQAIDEFKRLRPFLKVKDRIKTLALVQFYEKYTKKKD